MKLLFDQNLSFHLPAPLADEYSGFPHVRSAGLEAADDETIWRHAAAHGFVIASKDSDFHQMSLLRGHPPKVVWLRVGNAPTSAIADLLREHHATMTRFHEGADSSLLALA